VFSGRKAKRFSPGVVGKPFGGSASLFLTSLSISNTPLTLNLSDLVKAVVAYHGSLYADPATGAVWRITDTASDIPPALLTREISTTIDYDEVSIGTNKYLLPVEAIVSLLLENKKVRNEMEFRNYRKFEADSSIVFGPAETAAPKK